MGKNKKTLIILVFTGVIAILGYWYLTSLKTKPQEKTDATVTNNVDSGNDEISKWPVYTNEKFQYRISYHPDWKMQGENEPPYPPPPIGMSFSRRYPDGTFCDFEILSSSENDPHAGEIQDLRTDKKELESQDLIDGQRAIVFDSSGGEKTNVFYYFANGNLSYRMGYNLGLAGQNTPFCREVFAKMIRSFEFIK